MRPQQAARILLRRIAYEIIGDRYEQIKWNLTACEYPKRPLHPAHQVFIQR